MRRTIIIILLAGALALGGTACGDDTDDGGASGSSTENSSFPVTIDAPNGEVTLEEQPERIVSISPTATEMLFAIGAGDQVVAADDFSNYPEDAPTTDISLSSPNVEAIIGYEPDLVVLSDGAEDVIDPLEAVEIPVIVEPAAVELDDAYTQIEQLGAATGHGAEATEVVDQMQADIDEITAGVVEREEPLTYYHELDNTLFSVTSNTFIGQLYALAGLTNIADAAQADAGDYPQLSAEFLVQEDPDLVFLGDTKCCGEDAETFAARPGFGELSAVVDGNVVELDDDIASRWGPRVVDLLRTIVEAANQVPASSP
jgi:iron complex transport system substrate-binding protein